MSTKRETILVALFAYLTTALPTLTVARNPALQDVIDGQAIALRDGENELTEEFINGDVYEFTMTPSVSIVFEKDLVDIDKQVDDAVDLVALALAGAGDLGGLAMEIRVLPPATATQEIFGSNDLKGADLTIEIDYWSDRRVG